MNRACAAFVAVLATLHCKPPERAAVPAEPVREVEAFPAPSAAAAPAPARNRAIVFVWDGLRPDSISDATTPNLARLRKAGVWFTDHHSVYPTFTMMNAAAFATGAYPSRHGFFGNTLFQPEASGANAKGEAVDFRQPVFTEDYGVLQALDRLYQRRDGQRLLLTETLIGAAHAAGMTTAVVGKTGSAFLLDYRLDGGDKSVFLDENAAAPLGFGRALQAAGFALPKNSARFPFPNAERLELAPNNGEPTAETKLSFVRLADGVTTDPRSSLGSPHVARNRYFMDVFVDFILPNVRPELSFIWLRNPDSTEHGFGPGSPPYFDALRAQDELLGKLLEKLEQLGELARTNLLIASDHGHSTVAGDPALFPLRALSGEADGKAALGPVDPARGYSVSGDVRSADLLRRAGFADVYDGAGCLHSPVLSGIRANGAPVYPTRIDKTGKLCNPDGSLHQLKLPASYNTAYHRVPATLPANAVIIAANGGSEYLYVPSRSRPLIERLVTALQERRVYGAIFVHDRYAPIAGTFELSAISARGARDGFPSPDVIVSFDSDDRGVTAANREAPGTEYASAQGNRGMHGSFSPVDVQCALVAAGPDFKSGYRDALPTGNVDVAPTLAELFGLSLPQADGRTLLEALVGRDSGYSVEPLTETAGPVTLRRTCNADDPDCARPSGKATYTATLYKKILSAGERRYSYWDQAKVTRQAAP